MIHAAILQPVVALAAWTLVVWAWMYATRIPAMQRAKIDAASLVGKTGASLRQDLIESSERNATWVATGTPSASKGTAALSSGRSAAATLAWSMSA